MKVLVTGSSGFLGNLVIQNLLGYSKIDITATSSGLDNMRERYWFDNVNHIAYDIRESTNEDLFLKFNQPDIVIHMAWAGLPNFKSENHIINNVGPQVHFLTNLIDNGATNITVTGTCLEYGLQTGCLSEPTQANPTTAYGTAKCQVNTALEKLAEAKDIKLSWLRLFYMYDENQSSNSLYPSLITALKNNDTTFNMSKGDQKRDFLPAEIMADNICKLALSDSNNGVVNCCSGIPIKVLDLVNETIQASGKSIELNLGYYDYPDYEAQEFWGDSSKMNNILARENHKIFI